MSKFKAHQTGKEVARSMVEFKKISTGEHFVTVTVPNNEYLDGSLNLVKTLIKRRNAQVSRNNSD